MTPREAENLLGGYATGTLTEAERKALFAAALEDQALFDALADEEALRELLADSGTRARLLALLVEPARKPAVPLWRRPASLGLAASILAAVGVGLALRHGPAPEAARVHAPALPEERPKAAAPSQKAIEAPQPPVAERKRSFAKPSLRLDQAPAAPAPPATVASIAPPAENQAAPAPIREKAEARRAQQPPPAEAGVSLGAFAQDAAKAVAPHAPTWAWDDDEAGHRRLTVLWGPGGFLALVEIRSGRGRVIAPLSVTKLPDGRMKTLFPVPEGGPPLELFWTREQLSVSPMAVPPDAFRALLDPPKK